jgi:TonB family protein
MTAVKSCYQRALKRNPNLAGKITIRLVINTMGKVSSVYVETDSLGDPSVTSCIKGYAKRWRFPPPDGGSAEIAVPFNFKAAQ